MPPKITSTWSCCDELRRLLGRDGVVGGAVLEEQLERAAEQAALRVDVVDDHAGDVGVGDADERERAGLVRDHAHLDGCSRLRASCLRLWRCSRDRASRSTRRASVCDEDAARHRPRRYIGSTPYLFSAPPPRRVRRPRWRSRRTTPSGSRSSRSCARACSRAGCARRRVRPTTCATPSTGSRCCATSAAPVTRTRSPPCSATRSRSGPRRSSHDAGNPAEVMRRRGRVRDRVASRGGARGGSSR